MQTTMARSLLVTLLAAALTGPVLPGTASAAVAGRAAAGRAQTTGPPQGPLLAWGLNEVGELGTGDKNHYDGPVKVNSPYGLRASSARSGNTSVAVNSSGQAFTW